MAGAAILKNPQNISATVRSIATKFGTVTQFDTHDAYHGWKFAISKIQDGGSRHFENLKNRHISAAVSAILTKFRKVTQFDPLDPFGTLQI